MAKKRVVVTGASGFLGRHVVPALTKRGFEITTLDRSASDSPNHCVLDLSQEVPTKALQGVDAIVHLAGNVNIKQSIEEPHTVMRDNLAMTLNILEAVRTQEKKPLVILLSTDRVYGKARGRVTEQSPTFPIEPYVASKLMSETALVAYANLYEIPFVIIRASAFFGPYQPRRSFIADVIQKMKESDEITVGPLKTIKDFIYVSDVADAVIAALKAPSRAHNRIYNIGGKPVSLETVLSHIKTIVERRLKKKIRVRVDRRAGSYTKHEIGPFRFSTSAAQKFLRWKQKIPLKKGLELTVDHFLDRKST